MTGGPPGGGGQPLPAVIVETRSTAGTEAAQQALGTLASGGGADALAAGGPAAPPPGWLRAPQDSRALLGEIAEIAERARADGLDHVVLAGSADQAIAPEVIARTAGVPLTVLDHRPERSWMPRPIRPLLEAARASRGRRMAAPGSRSAPRSAATRWPATTRRSSPAAARRSASSAAGPSSCWPRPPAGTVTVFSPSWWTARTPPASRRDPIFT